MSPVHSSLYDSMKLDKADHSDARGREYISEPNSLGIIQCSFNE